MVACKLSELEDCRCSKGQGSLRFYFCVYLDQDFLGHVIPLVCRFFVLGVIDESHDEDHAMLVEGPANNGHRNLESLATGLAVTFRAACNPHAVHDLTKGNTLND